MLAVDEEIGEGAHAGDLAHILVESAEQLVLDEGVVPVVVPGAQNDSRELLGVGLGKQRVFEPVRAILAAEVQSQANLAVARPVPVLALIAGPNPRASVDAQAAVDVEVLVVIERDPLRRNGALETAVKHVVVAARARGGPDAAAVGAPDDGHDAVRLVENLAGIADERDERQ